MGIKSKQVKFNPVAPLYFIISGGTSSISPQYKKDKIVSLAMPNNSFIAVGDKLKIKGEPYKINIIEKIKDGSALVYHLKTAERTKSSIFVLPMLSGDRHLFLYDSNLINAFINYSDMKDHIVLLYRWSVDPLFSKFDLALRKFPTFVKAFDADVEHTVYIFSIPEHHLLNFKYFKEGKYSKIDDDFKLKVLEFHGMGVDSSLSKILFKAEERKKELEAKLDAEIPENSELLSIINIETETLNLDYYL